MHRTDNENDGYFGSGTRLKIAIKKYGKCNFSIEILFRCSCYQEMVEKESELVDIAFVKRKDTYNLNCGGAAPGIDRANVGGRSKYTMPEEHKKHISEATKGKKRSLDTRNRMSLSRIGKKMNLSKQEIERRREQAKKMAHNRIGSKHSKETKALMSLNNGMKGKKHSEATKKTMSERRSGINNYAFGLIWIHNPNGDKKRIPKSELDVYLCGGWTLGRK